MNGVRTDIVPHEFNQPSYLVADRKIAFERNRTRMIFLIFLFNSTFNKAHDRNKKYFDKNKVRDSFDIGERIYVENGNKLTRRKLDEIRVGPYTVVNKLSKTVYEIDTGKKTHNRRLYHISK